MEMKDFSKKTIVEFLNDKTPKCIYERFSNLVDEGFVIVKDIDVDDEVMEYYITFITTLQGVVLKYLQIFRYHPFK